MKNKIIKIWLFLIGIIILDIGLLFINKSTTLLFLYLQLVFIIYNFTFKNNYNKKYKLIFIIFFLFLTFMFLFFEIYEIIAFILIFLIVYFLNKLRMKNFILFLFLFSFIIRLIFILVVDTPPFSDFSKLFNASKLFSINDYTFNKDSYFVDWAYQIGFVAYQGILLKFINDVLFLKIVNCLITSSLCVLIYLISKKLCNEKSARIVSVFYSCFIFSIAYSSVLTNQHLSSLLTYLGIYILIQNKLKIKNYRLKDYQKNIISGILISLGNIIRPEGIITIFSLLLYFVLTMKKKNIKKLLLTIITIISAYYLTFMLVSFVLVKLEAAPSGLKNNAPQWKFVLGFNFDTNGVYCESDAWTIYDKEGAYSLVKNRIKENYEKIPTLFYNKSKTFWVEPTLYWPFSHILNRNEGILNVDNKIDAVNKISQVDSAYFFLIFVFAIIGMFNIINNYKGMNKKMFIILNQIMVTFLVYLLIEVQSRYSYFIQISIFILAAYGIDYFEVIKKKIKFWR